MATAKGFSRVVVLRVCVEKKSGGERGFSLVEVSVVLLIAGILAVGVIALIRPFLERGRILQTHEKLEKIAAALDAYAIENNRFPCPALPNRGAASPPYGFEGGSGAAGAAIPSPECPVTGAGVARFAREGIVPFRTLGLPEDLIYDGWGAPITYTISLAFGQNNDAGLDISGSASTIHPQCRTRDWMYDAGVDTVGGIVSANKNPAKARFCCPGSAAPETSDLDVRDEDGNPVLPLWPNRKPGPDGYQSPSTLMRPVGGVVAPDCTGGTLLNPGDTDYFIAPQVPPVCARATAVAYVLISHGPNGLGVYNLSTGLRAGPAPINPAEAENTDGDVVFSDQFSRSTSNDVNEMDDIVLWRTQDMMFARQEKSCAMP